MINIENVEVNGFEAAIRGMRNPLESWERMDSYWGILEDPTLINPMDEVGYIVGPNDLNLMSQLSNAGADHGKFLRMINVTCDIEAPLYWWKEFDTYKVGTVRNSCSTMHKIHSKKFTLNDFSVEHLAESSLMFFRGIIHELNNNRNKFIDTGDKTYWWQMIQLLPSSYNQKATIQLNYQVLKNMYHARKNHKLDEWKSFCNWLESLPYAEIITGIIE